MSKELVIARALTLIDTNLTKSSIAYIKNALTMVVNVGYDFTPDSLLEKEERIISLKHRVDYLDSLIQEEKRLKKAAERSLDEIKTKLAYEKAKNRRHKKHIAALIRGDK